MINSCELKDSPPHQFCIEVFECICCIKLWENKLKLKLEVKKLKRKQEKS